MIKNHCMIIVMLVIFSFLSMGNNGCKEKSNKMEQSLQGDHTAESKLHKFSIEEIVSDRFPSLLTTYSPSKDSGCKFSTYSSNLAFCNIEKISYGDLEIFNIHDFDGMVDISNRIKIQLRYGYSHDSSICYLVVISEFFTESGYVGSGNGPYTGLYLISDSAGIDMVLHLRQSTYNIESIKEIDNQTFVVTEKIGSLFSSPQNRIYICKNRELEIYE